MNDFELKSGNINKGQPSYICSTSEFVQTTDAENGSNLIVVNESTHKVENYYIAYNGYWNEL